MYIQLWYDIRWDIIIDNRSQLWRKGTKRVKSTGCGFDPHSNRVPLLIRQCLQNSAESGERGVLRLGTLCLSCCVRIQCEADFIYLYNNTKNFLDPLEANYTYYWTLKSLKLDIIKLNNKLFLPIIITNIFKIYCLSTGVMLAEGKTIIYI